MPARLAVPDFSLLVRIDCSNLAYNALVEEPFDTPSRCAADDSLVERLLQPMSSLASPVQQ